MSDDIKQNIVERICPICGKRFIRAPDHVYKDGNITVCRWSCLCELRRRKEAKRTAKPRVRKYSDELKAKAIDMVVNQGITRKATAAQLGATPEIVSMWVTAYKKKE